MYDVAIIGAGVVGCSIARELSKYNLNIVVVDKAADVASGATKANSAVIHAGYDAKPGTLKALLNSKGSKMFNKLSKELDFPYKQIGSLVLCFSEKDMYKLEKLKAQGEENQISDLKIITAKEAIAIEPSLSKRVQSALYAPTAAIVCPYEMTIALAENAFTNGCEFKLNYPVTHISEKNQVFGIGSNAEVIEARILINAAGVFAAEINNMISDKKQKIIPRIGEYCLFDKEAGALVKTIIFQLPSNKGKGVLITPTVDGNLLIGPSAKDISCKEDLVTTKEGMESILNKASLSIEETPLSNIITSFSGIRAHSDHDDFIIGECEDVKGFINAAGIESPGLSSAPAIADMIGDIVIQKLDAKLKNDFNPIRKGIPRFRELSNEERNKLIKSDAAYGKIVCRCELVTEGEIVNAIRRPVGARTLDGIKIRTRAGMGRCQAGFCQSKVMAILIKELNLKPTEVTKFGKKSNLIVGEGKEFL